MNGKKSDMPPCEPDIQTSIEWPGNNKPTRISERLRELVDYGPRTGRMNAARGSSRQSDQRLWSRNLSQNNSALIEINGC